MNKEIIIIIKAETRVLLLAHSIEHNVLTSKQLLDTMEVLFDSETIGGLFNNNLCNQCTLYCTAQAPVQL